jgi:hypothetical protein
MFLVARSAVGCREKAKTDRDAAGLTFNRLTQNIAALYLQNCNHKYVLHHNQEDKPHDNY